MAINCVITQSQSLLRVYTWLISTKLHVSFKNLFMDILTVLYVILLVENHCRPTNPCKNDGLCVEMDDGYKCRCKGGYKGVDCEGKHF